MAETDDGILTLLASWLLAHELADDWVRDAVERGRAEDADPLALLAARVDDRKSRLKEALAHDVGSTEAPADSAELKEAIEALSRRLGSIEARLDGMSRDSEGS